MVNLDELRSNIKEYLEDADYLFNKGHYNSVLNLYFKALVAICDYIILRDTGRLPRNHAERFRILEEKYPEIYRHCRLPLQQLSQSLLYESHKRMGGGAEE
ncbi:hypothetical protein [Thermococcus chitonophagus]|uniref:HEPN domain-containing protein n=1 Tax=Thermococcus chitonophagus TaxID=54262 RepID=A0A161KED6_9EURY|nr:hypothetical protein [Thermococcus chitonophagus]CUX77738.1 hypothetical protein CHITON_0959 [Thermococcus chitonophagus]